MLGFVGGKWSIDTFLYFESALAKTSGRKGVGSFPPFPPSESLGPLPFRTQELYHIKKYILWIKQVFAGHPSPSIGLS